MTIEQAFGHILRRHREIAGISQESLALACGIDRTFVSMLERGKRQPTLKTLFKIADSLDLPPSKLISEVEATLAV